MNVERPETINAIARQGMICATEWIRQGADINGTIEPIHADIETSKDALGCVSWNDEQYDMFRKGFYRAVDIMRNFEDCFSEPVLVEKVADTRADQPIKLLATLEDMPEDEDI